MSESAPTVEVGDLSRGEAVRGKASAVSMGPRRPHGATRLPRRPDAVDADQVLYGLRMRRVNGANWPPGRRGIPSSWRWSRIIRAERPVTSSICVGDMPASM